MIYLIIVFSAFLVLQKTIITDRSIIFLGYLILIANIFYFKYEREF
jgi:hypothetical protein